MRDKIENDGVLQNTPMFLIRFLRIVSYRPRITLAEAIINSMKG